MTCENRLKRGFWESDGQDMQRFISGGLKILLAGFSFLALVSINADQGSGPAQGAPDHGSALCSHCHLPSARSAGNSEMHQSETLCRNCHIPQAHTGGRRAGAFHDDGTRNCLDCHSFHESNVLKVGGETFAFAYNNPSLSNHCVSCHNPEADLTKLSDGHRAAGAFYHSKTQTLGSLTPSEGCLVCHSMNSAGPDLKDDAVIRAPRFMDSASHGFGIPVVLGSTISSFSIRRELDPRIKLFGDQIECQTCHEIASGTDWLLVEFETAYGICEGCHERRHEARETLRLAER